MLIFSCSIGTSGADHPAAGFVQTARVLRGKDAGNQLGPEPKQHLYFDVNRAMGRGAGIEVPRVGRTICGLRP